MLANSRRQKFIEDYYKGTAVSEESYPYEYLYHLKQEPILAFFLFTVEILNLKGYICILEREKEYLKPLRFKILNPEGCRGSFDIIFSLKSEESEGDPDNGQNEQSAPTVDEMVWFDDDRRPNPLHSFSPLGAFTTPMPKLREMRTFDDLKRVREEEYYASPRFRSFKPLVLQS